MTNVEFRRSVSPPIRRELESQEFMRLVGAEVVDVALGEVTAGARPQGPRSCSMRAACSTAA